MTLEMLEQYADICSEIKTWETELNALYRKYGGKVTDTVRGSSEEYPYTEHPITISGVQTQPNKRIRLREERLKWRRTEAEEKREQIEDFIDMLQDSQLKLIIHYRYIRGYSWVKTAHCMGGKNSADAIKKKVYRYFSKSA